VRSLREALGNGQLEVHYQPVVDPLNVECMSAEALLRWRHPERGVIEPMEFLEAARECQLLPQLDRFTLCEAAMQREEWRSRGIQTPISLNLAYESLRTAGGLEGIMASCDSRLEGLIFEFSHESLRYILSRFPRTLDTCYRNGILFIVDDFGGPKSTMFDIGALPVKSFKVDRRCVAALPYHDGAMALFEAIRDVSQTLGYQLYGKGVENRLQQDWLSGRCDGLQGFAIARPMRPLDFERWLRHRDGGLLEGRAGTPEAAP